MNDQEKAWYKSALNLLFTESRFSFQQLFPGPTARMAFLCFFAFLHIVSRKNGNDFEQEGELQDIFRFSRHPQKVRRNRRQKN